MSTLEPLAPSANPLDDNVDPDEAARYAALAGSWWDRTGPFWPLHRLNTLRAAYLREQLAHHFARDAGSARPLADLDVLDVGCGGGILSESMAALGARVHGIDVVEKNISVARHHARESGVEVDYELAVVDALGERGDDFDVVLNMEVVEHVPDVPAFMRACARLVRPGGVMTVATINRNALSWLFAIVGAEYVLGWLPRGTHQWSRFVTPAEATTMLDDNGLHVLARSGVRVNPINRQFSLTERLAVNYMLIAGRPRDDGASE